MQVIGAGFGRTGTDSIRRALELLLGGRCYHMKELITRRDHVEHWADFVAAGRQGMDWTALFDGYEATVDWPGANYYAEIMEAFPESKILLSVRDPDSWFDSFQVLVRIMGVMGALSFVPPIGFVKKLHNVAIWHEFEDLHDRASSIAVFERHIAEVKAHVPPERLLVYRVQEGWEPLCRFLDMDVPDTPFPHVNSGSDIQKFAARKIAIEIAKYPFAEARMAFDRFRCERRKGENGDDREGRWS